MLKLRKTLLSNYFYIFLIILVSLISLIRITYPVKVEKQDDTYFYGRITKYNITSTKLTIYLKNKQTLIGTYYFLNDKEIENFKNISLGDKVIVKATISKPLKNRTNNTFNYQKYLAHKKIYYLLKIEKIKRISKNKNIYYYLKNLIYKRIGNDKYLNTFLLGNKSYLEKEVLQAYQEIGISHLFAISGMHISILSSILLKILGKKKNKSYFLVSIILLIYLLIIDTSSSAIRGCLFFILFSINKIYYFYVPPLKIYLLTLLITLLINPFYIFEVGFLYSFSISFSLLYLSSELKGNYFFSLLKVSLISFIVSIPISLYNFCELNLLSIIYNLFFVPLISLIIFPLEIISFFIPFLSKISLLFINILESSALFLNKIDIVKLNFYKFNIAFYLGYAMLIILLLLEIKKKHTSKMLIIIIILLISHYFYKDNKTFIKMLDIGQGDSILIYSKGEAILVDTGGVQEKEDNLVRNITLPVLKSLGVKKLKKLIITHGDYDHIGEADYLLKHFKVEEVLINNNKINYYEKQLLKYKAKQAKEGYTFTLKDIVFVQLNKNLEDENDSSLVFLGIYKDKSFLLMGDSSSKTEEYLLKRYNLKNITILKVGHHGSKTSTSDKFIEEVKPKISLISAGIDNKFKHPHKEILKKLQDSLVYVTKDKGTITVNLDNLNVKYDG